jgi:hypothetical protein
VREIELVLLGTEGAEDAMSLCGSLLIHVDTVVKSHCPMKLGKASLIGKKNTIEIKLGKNKVRMRMPGKT